MQPLQPSRQPPASQDFPHPGDPFVPQMTGRKVGKIGAGHAQWPKAYPTAGNVAIQPNDEPAVATPTREWRNASSTGMADSNRMKVEALEGKVGTKCNNSLSLAW
ncbi:hypothetical protein GB937_006033 [Aspergillus fischeri]|nr:hypothetical protein GB937_006033 [Aspergillus fischeri]